MKAKVPHTTSSHIDALQPYLNIDFAGELLS